MIVLHKLKLLNYISGMEAGVFLLLFSFITQSIALDIKINEEFGEKIEGTSSNTPLGTLYLIDIHEEMDVPLVLGYLTDAGSSPTVNFILPDRDANTYLGLAFSQSSGTTDQWDINISIKQDFENSYFGTSQSKNYYFSITVGSETILVQINLININDNRPIVSVHDSSCPIEENTLDESECTYTITDEDGYMLDMEWSLGANDDDFDFIITERATDVFTKSISLKLTPKKELDYENIALYIMDWIVYDTPIVFDDIVRNGTAKIVVEVQDMPDEDPVWTSIFASQQFDEMEAQTFYVTARDGDIGINDEIVYSKDDSWNQYISIDKTTGEITVLEIDRDADDEIIYTFIISACEVQMPEACIHQSITFLVEDINNKLPIITVTSLTTTVIPENSFQDLGFEIYAHDLDMGENAMYDINLISDDIFHDAFTVAPSTGYQMTNIYIYIVNYTMLDYDREEKWRKFTITLTTKDRTSPFNPHEQIFTIELTNENDEVPIFQFTDDDEDSTYIAYVPETVGLGWPVKQVYAKDDDIDDVVNYGLLGTFVNRILSIDELSGEIVTAVDAAFDYETQEEVVLQIQATDTLKAPFNTAIAQLTINVIDVNDETPRITVGSQRVEVYENRDHGTEIVNNTVDFLVATDDDQGAILVFSINWENSYATKNGRMLTDEEFEIYKNCIDIDPYHIDSTTGKGKSAMALLSINEVVAKNTPDYEIFHVLYINVVVTDTDQEINDGEASVTVPIYILNVNDVAPNFVQSTIDSNKAVNEHADIETTIAIIIATDEDSDTIYYSLTADDEQYKGLVEINDLGELYVAGDIDADIPKLYTMSFTVVASDGELENSTQIIISVNDINDNSPKFIVPVEGNDFEIEEKKDNETVITKLEAIDNDRDAPNNEVTYQLSNSNNIDISNYFGIVDDDLIVAYRDSSYALDRDNENPAIINTIRVRAVDGNVNDPRSSEVAFTVTLTDINDNAPVIQTLQFTTSESLLQEEEIDTIRATDADKPNTDNTKITFEIITISADEESKEAPDNMFKLTNFNNDDGTCSLVTGIDLELYHGTYSILIKASDFGIPQQSEIYTITVTIEKYNFYKPAFYFPTDGEIVYLAMEQTIGSQLRLYDGETLQEIRATDQQNDKFSLIFTVPDSDVFTILSTGELTGQLQLLSEATEISYRITIQAVADAVNPLPETVSLNIQFIDTSEQPKFSDRQQTIYFLENATDDVQWANFNKAEYSYIPDGLENLYPIYYTIIGNERENFEIEDTQLNTITLNTILDREEEPTRTVQIQASNVPEGVANGEEETILVITVVVVDVNDNPPHFDSEIYYNKISTTTSAGTDILQVYATDADINDTLTYYMHEYEYIPDVITSEDPFDIDEDSGVISSKIEIPQAGDGYFLFSVRVSDGAHSNYAHVHIYMVSDAHRVEFIFRNDLATVTAAQPQIIVVLQSHFDYNVIIEEITPNTDDSGNAMDDQTVVRAYFVNSEIYQAIARTTIEATANDVNAFGSLLSRFLEYNLELASFSQNTVTQENMEEVLKAWLIGVAIVLGTVCVLLLVAFILKTRSLTKRLNKLSVIRYGSQESGLNRKVAPTTNKHAVEGSNPAYNEDKVRSPENDDAMSVGSGDSDLVGVENNPEFDYNYEVKNRNPGTSNELN